MLLQSLSVLSLATSFASSFVLPVRDTEALPPTSFSLEVARSETGKRDFQRDWAAARQKWGGSTLKSRPTPFSLADDDGLVDVHPMGNDDLYLADIQIGNPPQTVKLALDTGSSDVWVQSTDTKYRVNRNGPWAPQYRPKDSQTSSLINESRWDVQYLDGTSAFGIVYHDTIRFGNIEVENATVQSAQTMASRFETDIEMSGIMGLAKRLRNNIDPPVPTFMDMLTPLLDSPVFTVDLKKNATGQFEFGRIDMAKASDNITWLDSVGRSAHWDVNFDLTSWTIPDQTWWYYPFSGTIDTGTTLMFLPSPLASRYWYSVPGMRQSVELDGAYTFPCANAKDLPDLLLKLPGTEHILTIPGRYLNYGPADPRGEYCWGGMQSAEGMQIVVLGDVMLKALFVAFDLDKQRVGFANKVLTDEM
ncbi:endothiapepsin precursor [Cordyceps militaris CM01]|uniref:Endothiapepsin n=1 Tax=Cordyceps militaris (strain CM01) TaxID=983644 RepID=G3JRD6_CORMM|nr:endothiapepsin precursor [Cordyceps militaris CM01]EGX88486.1 endothiapepsin precursor [Cordyceps militaris CM01]